jgi:uncharacterized protein (TIGR00255 family)
MLQSMTGYAAKNFTFKIDMDNEVNVLISLKTLNSRYFELTPKLPHVFYPLETQLISYFKKKLKRGHTYLYVSLSNPNAFKTDIEPSLTSLKGYLSAIEKIKETFNIKDSVSISDILSLPNILITKEETLSDNLKTNFFDAIEILTQEITNERAKEGAELQKDIEKRITLMCDSISEVHNIFETESQKRQQEIDLQLKNLDSESAIDEIKIKALYFELDKMDINEEIVRFKSHLQNLKDIISSSQSEKGKQLDFTLQELGREINTILAKTSSSGVSSLALKIKVEIEKTREQTQNIV